MPDPWRSWDERLKFSGLPRRVAEDLTDIELLNLLAVERSGNRQLEKEVIKQELYDRLHHRP